MLQAVTQLMHYVMLAASPVICKHCNYRIKQILQFDHFHELL